MQPARMATADLITALCLMALGLGVLLESWRMPRFEQLAINPYTVPGIVPGLLGAIILLLGTILLARSIRRGGWPGRARADVRAALVGDRPQRLVLILLLTLGYAAGLVGRLPFWFATMIFVALFIIVFEWRGRRRPAFRARSIAAALVEALVVAIGVSVIFEKLFLVRLP